MLPPKLAPKLGPLFHLQSQSSGKLRALLSSKSSPLASNAGAGSNCAGRPWRGGASPGGRRGAPCAVAGGALAAGGMPTGMPTRALGLSRAGDPPPRGIATSAEGRAAAGAAAEPETSRPRGSAVLLIEAACMSSGNSHSASISLSLAEISACNSAKVLSWYPSNFSLNLSWRSSPSPRLLHPERPPSGSRLAASLDSVGSSMAAATRQPL